MKSCAICYDKFNGSSKCCSKDCETEFSQLADITIPRAWVYKTLQKERSYVNRVSMLRSFCKRHDYDYRLTVIQLREMFKYRLEMECISN